MQVSAIAPGAAARIDSSAVLVLRPMDLCFRLLEAVWPRAAIVGNGGNPDDGSISTILALSNKTDAMVLSWAAPGFPSLIFRFCCPPSSHPRAGPETTVALLIFSTLGDGVNKKYRLLLLTKKARAITKTVTAGRRSEDPNE